MVHGQCLTVGVGGFILGGGKPLMRQIIDNSVLSNATQFQMYGVSDYNMICRNKRPGHKCKIWLGSRKCPSNAGDDSHFSVKFLSFCFLFVVLLSFCLTSL